ncbi:helical backbone metal receptor [Nocardioides ganghwensis]|jgi:ABC-type Fe3+-hydroxamate transport system substrate-binding protein|uniref:Cobalamin-binding protein n=1 Tax=Nocardioides ganghwensis TaxID=252230 RepID=A0A4Q2SC93_9ACTN|nr:helical backbone metal receptor [Nocardioides ganghwensis]MBD3945456.1 cobalamin-binding protein [Nocardioides ganghwensis]RYC02314.1 cobalamin-binding protein [Nocardioides ganghwensis]
MRDDLGADVPLSSPARRIVSLVPSLTEALAATETDLLVGATDWCTHPADLDVPRVRGTKNPDLAAIRGLAPDLVVANMEENRELDVRRLRDAGVAVWVTRIETVEQALGSMSRLFSTALGLADPPWLAEARSLWAPPPPPRLRVAVPIWRDPWMVVGSQTYTDDLLARAGLANVLAHGPAAREGRYPTVTPDEIDDAAADLVLLPDEPYVFTADDGPEALRTPTRLVSGRLLTWYGPAMVEAHAVLAGLSG